MKWLVAFFAVLATAPGFAARASGPVVYDITRLTATPPPDGVPGDVTLVGGKRLELGMSWSSGQKILFEDLVPGANWSHPAKYKVVGADGKVVQEVQASLPPERLSEAPVVKDSGLALGRETKVEFKLSDFGGAMKVKDPAKYYAILINGHADLRHWNDFSFFYRVLTQVYGYIPGNIFVADSAYKDRRPDLDGSGIPRIQFESTVAGVKDMLQKVKEKMKADDHLVLAVNDHGGVKDNESTIILYDGEIKASEFAGLMASFPNERVLSIFEQCFSGGFVRPTVAGRRVSMAAAQNTEYSWATADLNFDEFIYHVIAAFAKQTHDGQPVQTDTSRDARVSAQQAFAYAVGKDGAAESPLLEAATNTGASPAIGLAF